MSRKLNVGVLSCANIAVKSILPALKYLNKHFNIIGIASRSPEKANKFSDVFDIKPYYDYNEILKYSNLDAIYIPLPNSLHAKWIEKALDAGVNVLVEKTMTCNHADTMRLNTKARNKNLVLMENFQFRFHPQLQSILQLINDGEIGELRSVKSTFAFPPFSDPYNIRYSSELGGGALLDVGAYPLKILQIFMGHNIDVVAATSHFDTVKNVDLWGSGFVKSADNNVSGSFNFGFDNYYQCELELIGSVGRIYTDRIFTAPPNYSPSITISKNGLLTKIVTIEPSNHFVNALLHFKNQILDGQKLSDEYSQNINQSRLISQFRSAVKLTSQKVF